MFINPEFGSKSISTTEISVIHSVFNIATTVLLYPFSNLLIKIAEFLVRNIKDDGNQLPVHLDVRILQNPNFAVQSCVKEVIRMGYMAQKNLKESFNALYKLDLESINKVLEREKQIDELNHAITKYLVKICNIEMDRKENKFLTRLFHALIDIERVGDHCENIAESAKFMLDENLSFSEQAQKELKEIFEMTINCYETSIKSLEENDKALAQKVIKSEQLVDNLEKKLRNTHVERLSNNLCDPKSSIAFLDTITNLERIADHALNISRVVLKYKRVKASDQNQNQNFDQDKNQDQNQSQNKN